MNETWTARVIPFVTFEDKLIAALERIADAQETTNERLERVSAAVFALCNRVEDAGRWIGDRE